jgi:hypothetical protein
MYTQHQLASNMESIYPMDPFPLSSQQYCLSLSEAPIGRYWADGF